MKLDELVVLIKGAGELASGVAHRLSRSHFKVCMTEIAHPQAVRREVSFCEAVYDGEKEVEGVVTRLISSPEEVPQVWREGKIPRYLASAPIPNGQDDQVSRQDDLEGCQVY